MFRDGDRRGGGCHGGFDGHGRMFEDALPYRLGLYFYIV
jgi:hypothetical protein